MWPPAKTMTMSAAPMASGAMTPAPAPIPVQPIVRTRKKVPMNSAMYLFIVICYANQLRKSKTCQQWDFGLIDSEKRRTLSAEHPTSSKLQTRAEAEPVAFDALADVEVVDPPRTEIEMISLTKVMACHDGSKSQIE